MSMHVRRLKFILALSLAVAVVCGAISAHAAAQTSRGPELGAKLGFDGAFQHEAWSPVQVQIASGSVRLRGHVQITVPLTTLLSVRPSFVHLTLPVDLEAGTHTDLWTTVPLRNAPYPLEIRLVAANGRILAERSLSLQGGAVSSHLAYVLDPSARSWSWLSAGTSAGGRPGGTFGYAVSAGDLPADPLALSALSALIIQNDFSLRTLSPGQLEAVAQYVRFGGHLILIGGSQPPTFPPEWSAWLPSVVSPDVGFITTPAGPAVPAWRLLPPGTSDNPDPVLAHSEPYGAGRVTIFAVNPAVQAARAMRPVSAWAEDVFWRDAHPQTGRPTAQLDEIWRLVDGAVVPTGLPVLLMIFLGGYVAAAIAITYVGVRRPMLLCALPVVALMSWYAASTHVHSPGFQERVSFVEYQLSAGVSDGVVVNYSFASISSGSPHGTPLTVRARAPLPFPAERTASGDLYTRHEGGRVQVDGVGAGRAVRFVHEGLEELRVFAHAVREGGVTLHVRNDSPYRLRHVFAVERTRFAYLGTIEPGETLRRANPYGNATQSGWVVGGVTQALQRLERGTRPDLLETRLLAVALEQALAGALFPGRPELTVLVALVDSPTAITVDPVQFERSLRVVILPMNTQPPEWIQGATNP